jgi:hypothetical protein
MDEITLTKEEYRKLLESEIRIKLFATYVNSKSYSISKEECADLLGFELERKEGEE